MCNMNESTAEECFVGSENLASNEDTKKKYTKTTKRNEPKRIHNPSTRRRIDGGRRKLPPNYLGRRDAWNENALCASQSIKFA